MEPIREDIWVGARHQSQLDCSTALSWLVWVISTPSFLLPYSDRSYGSTGCAGEDGDLWKGDLGPPFTYLNTKQKTTNVLSVHHAPEP